jgi:hypothetical protein
MMTRPLNWEPEDLAIQTLPRTTYVTLGKSFPLSGPLFPYLLRFEG